MEREKLFNLIRKVLMQDGRAVFAYAYGSFARGESFRDIDIGVHVKNPEELAHLHFFRSLQYPSRKPF
jgi:predicted nucleotidyltransferase